MLARGFQDVEPVVDNAKDASKKKLKIQIKNIKKVETDQLKTAIKGTSDTKKKSKKENTQDFGTDENKKKKKEHIIRKNPKALPTRKNKTGEMLPSQLQFKGGKDLLNYKKDNTRNKKPNLNDIMNLDNQEFAQSQTDWKKALRIYKEEFNVLSKDDYEDQLNDITNENEHLLFQQQQAELLKEAKLFACLQK